MKNPNLNMSSLLDATVQERIDYIHQKRWIGYPTANKLLDKMNDLLNQPQTHRMPNLLIKAETNNGKSFILNRFLSQNKSYETINNEFHIPVVKIEIPADPSTDIIYSEILHAMSIPYRATFKKEVKAHKVFNAFERFHVRMLMVDELHVLMNTTRLKKSQLLDTLKYISNRTNTVIVGAGTAEAHTALMSDPQLANRFEPYSLPQWKLNSEYRRLLATFEKLLPLKETSSLQSQLLATEIYSKTNGWIGEIDSLLKKAAILAIRSEEEKITMETLNNLDWISPDERRFTGI